MIKITYITATFAVAPALGEGDLDRVVELGFRTVINNRPDAEERAQPSSAALGAAAAQRGLDYRHIPTRKTEVFTDPVVDPTVAALRDAQGPILAFCKSGLRSAIAWAAASARGQPVESVLSSLAAAGFDVGFIRDDLDSQADRARWNDGAHAPEADLGTLPKSAGRAVA